MRGLRARHLGRGFRRRRVAGVSSAPRSRPRGGGHVRWPVAGVRGPEGAPSAEGCGPPRSRGASSSRRRGPPRGPAGARSAAGRAAALAETRRKGRAGRGGRERRGRRERPGWHEGRRCSFYRRGQPAGPRQLAAHHPDGAGAPGGQGHMAPGQHRCVVRQPRQPPERDVPARPCAAARGGRRAAAPAGAREHERVGAGGRERRLRFAAKGRPPRPGLRLRRRPRSARPARRAAVAARCLRPERAAERPAGAVEVGARCVRLRAGGTRGVHRGARGDRGERWARSLDGAKRYP